MTTIRQLVGHTLRNAVRLPVRFSLSSLFIVVAAAALIMAWNISAQGSVPIHTGRELDLAVFGIGYFQVTYPNGQIYYTRNGHFSLNPNGQIVSGRSEDDLQIEQSISVPQDCNQIHISRTGLVRVRQGKSGMWSQVGQIGVVRFVNPEGLTQIGPDMWGETETSGPPLAADPGNEGTGFVYQGWLEPTSGPPREQLRNQLALVSVMSLAIWIVIQNRGMRRELNLLRQKLEVE